MGEEKSLARLRSAFLLSVIVLSMFAFIEFIIPVQAGAGTHQITAVYYTAYIYDDHDGWLRGAGEWYFDLYADGVWTGDVFYSRDGPGWADFSDRTRTWYVLGGYSTYFKCWAGEMDEGWDYTSTLTYYVYWPWPSGAINNWYYGNSKVGDVNHYYRYYIRNLYPTVGSISGPLYGYRLVAYTFSTTGSDPEGDSITYEWRVDGVVQAVTGSALTYTFGTGAALGSHTISVRTKDYFGAYSGYATKYFYIYNRAPTVGSISGPDSGYAGVAYTFSTTGSDPDGDAITYQWDVNGTIQPTTSSSLTYTFPTAGTYIVRARTKDSYGWYSSYSSKTVTITLPSITITKLWTDKRIYVVGDTIEIYAEIKEAGSPLTAGTVKANVYAKGVSGKGNVLLTTVTMTLVDAALGKWKATYGPIPAPADPKGYEGTYVVKVTAEHPPAIPATKSTTCFVAYSLQGSSVASFTSAVSPSRVVLGQDFIVKAVIKNPSATSQTLTVKLVLPSGMTLVAGNLQQTITLAAGGTKTLQWTLKSTTIANKLVKINVVKGTALVAKLFWYIRDPAV